MDKVLIVCGPTATGKTKLAVELAKKFNGELVSADSRQVYKELTILSGKDIPKISYPHATHNTAYHNQKKYPLVSYDIDRIPVWMYDVVSVAEPFSVAQYKYIAQVAIADIQRRKKLPIVVGGTGFYIRGFIKPAETFEVPLDTRLRKSLDRISRANLQKELQVINAQKFHSMNPSDQKNPRRLIRAIEVALWRKKHGENRLSNDTFPEYLIIGLRTSLDRVKQRIQKRVIKRLNGAVQEVKDLIKRNIPFHLPPRSAIGIRLIEQYVRGDLTRQDLIHQWTHEEFSYAKRQLTWFKKDPSIHWFDIASPIVKNEVVSLVSAWYT